MAAQAAVTRRWVVMMAACRRRARLGGPRGSVRCGWRGRWWQRWGGGSGRRAAEKAWMAEAA
eukprot:3696445-Prymnesium_polylepis.1